MDAGSGTFGPREVGELFGQAIEQAQTLGPWRWGLTRLKDGVRLNVGWTEIVTAKDYARLLVVPDDLPRLLKQLPK